MEKVQKSCIKLLLNDNLCNYVKALKYPKLSKVKGFRVFSVHMRRSLFENMKSTASSFKFKDFIKTWPGSI